MPRTFPTNMMKKTTLFIICSSVAFATSGSACLASKAAEKQQQTVECNKKKEDLKMAMRKLWEDHITYTRNYIISDLGNLGDKDAVAKRLLKNQDDIGNAVATYYGNDAGKKLAKLLKDHILVAVEVVDAAKKGDKAALDKNQKKWSTNADEIAVFLSGANPNWKKDDISKSLQKHLELTTGEVVGRLNKDWNADIDSYDKGHEHMLMFADILTDGVKKQFPDKFN